MALTKPMAEQATELIDQVYRPRPEDKDNRGRRQVLSMELVSAFDGTEINSPMDVSQLLVAWRRAWDDSEDERIRVATRPSGWDLLNVYNRQQRVQEAARPSMGCEACGDRGRRTVLAVVFRKGLLRVEALVVACECGQGDMARINGEPLLKRIKVWRRDVANGEGRLQDAQIVYVGDAEPVYGSLVLVELSDVGIGEVLPDLRINELDMMLLRSKETC